LGNDDRNLVTAPNEFYGDMAARLREEVARLKRENALAEARLEAFDRTKH
jgi:hypothetical protein